MDATITVLDKKIHKKIGDIDCGDQRTFDISVIKNK